MEASFKSRVEHVFGGLLGVSSLGISVPQLAPVASSSSGATAWSVSEVAIPCNQGSTVVDESSESEADEPCAARYEEFVQLSKRRRRQDGDEDVFGAEDDDDDLDKGRAPKRRRIADSEGERVLNVITEEGLDEEEECRQMRLMVGMDDTLDFEEEEDEFDKVAVGREEAGGRYFMREIRGIPASLSLPDGLDGEQRRIGRDSRANHTAAAARLEEDDRLATIKSADVVEILKLGTSSSDVNMREAVDNDVNTSVASFQPVKGILSKLKSALKSTVNVPVNGNFEASSSTYRNDLEASSSNCTQSATEMEPGANSVEPNKSQEKTSVHNLGDSKTTMTVKRVRFAGCDEVPEDGKENVPASKSKVTFGGMTFKKSFGTVPDHVRNPFKYTHYTLDWSDEEDENMSNLTAFQETRVLARSSAMQQPSEAVELPKSITFTPRNGGISNKSNGEVRMSSGVTVQRASPLVSFVEDGVTVSGDSANLSETADETISEQGSSWSRNSRVFRKRARLHDEEDAKAVNDSPL